MPDLDLLSADEREAYESELVLSPERWAETVVAGVRRLADEAGLDRFGGRLIAPHEAGGEIVETSGDPAAVFGPVARCFAIEAPEPCDAIAAHPNGYFDGDLDPGANRLVAEMLRERFGLEVVGLGAALIALAPPDVLGRADARQLVEALRPAYRPAPPEVRERWADIVTGRRWLVASYRGG
ncbi:MAG: hypothetical protein AAGA99_17730 [Actinomycetota bacterium]